MRIGVFGGTFDPPHVGHLVVAQDAHAQLGLDRLLLVPARIPPHKPEGAAASAALRLEMLRSAVEGDARFEVDDLELRRDGPSYTVDTLRALGGRWPDAEFFLIIGADQFREFGGWRDAGAIVGMATLVVLARDGLELAGASRALAEAGVAAEWTRLEPTRIDVSSTMVRERVRAGRPIRYLVPDVVRAVIEREGLYTE